jgi:hypothetical protein
MRLSKSSAALSAADNLMDVEMERPLGICTKHPAKVVDREAECERLRLDDAPVLRPHGRRDQCFPNRSYAAVEGRLSSPRPPSTACSHTTEQGRNFGVRPRKKDT